MIKKILPIFIVCLFVGQVPSLAAETRDVAFDRIMKAQKIRCGYFLFPPMAVMDPTTKKLSGLAVDLFNKMGESMNLKVEWTEEVSFAGLIPGLQTNRYDVICTPLWPTAARAREVAFVTPTYFAALGVWVRADDNRFSEHLEKINDPAVTISGVDGQIEQTVHDEQFPLSKMLSLPSGTDFTESMMNVVTKKADVTFVDQAAGALFLQKQPGKVKNIAAGKPLRIFPFSIAVAGNEVRLKMMLDIAAQEMINTGFMARKLKQYDPEGLFLAASPAYLAR